MSYPTDNIYTEHHRRTAKWIVDDDTRLVHMELWLTPKEVVGLKLNETVWIDGRAYIINKIKDWDPKADRLTKVELITANDNPDLQPIPIILDPIVATGGNISYDQDGDDIYKIHTFLSNGQFNMTNGSPLGNEIEYLVIGGGGSSGHGSSFTQDPGAGGAGGYIDSSVTLPMEGVYDIVVGAGGTGVTSGARGNTGQPSSFGNIATATGGGGGGGASSSPSNNNNGRNGGSGGGGSQSGTGGSGITGQGHNGADGLGFNNSGGAGGGAGGAASGITPGSGKTWFDGVERAIGGSGNVAGGNSPPPANTGNGARASRTGGSTPSRPGASGVVILRYKVPVVGF